MHNLVQVSDLDGDGSLVYDEFKTHVMEARRTHEPNGVKEDSECECIVRATFDFIDKDTNGKITPNELNMMLERSAAEEEEANKAAATEKEAGAEAARSEAPAIETPVFDVPAADSHVVRELHVDKPPETALEGEASQHTHAAFLLHARPSLSLPCVRCRYAARPRCSQLPLAHIHPIVRTKKPRRR